MRPCLILAFCLVAGTAGAQPPPAAPNITKEAVRPAPESLLLMKLEKPNEIAGKRFSFSGILVELAKVDHPLQLLNPVAPTEYGIGEDNVVRDPITGKVTGLKFLSIQF